MSTGVIGRALKKGLAEVKTIDIRDFTTDRHRSADDNPFGGGAGMVMKPEPIARAVEAAGPVQRRIFVTPNGRPFTQADAVEWAQLDSMLLLCGRYEGVDERVLDAHFDERVSIGDYVISGGELASLVIIDATLRLVPGVLGNAESAVEESHSTGLLEGPHYTRPADWRGEAVPEVLLSGHHAKINAWRRQESLRLTARLRPDMLASAQLDEADRAFLAAEADKDREV